MRNKTHTIIIMDKSGSMTSCRNQAISDFNEQLQKAKSYADEQDILFSLITFDHEVHENVWEADVNSLQEITAADYQPNGGTAMRDAIGYVIDKIRQNANKNVAYFVNVITDGMESDSKHYSPEKLSAMITDCEGSKNWSFAVLGPNKNVLKHINQQTGIAVSNMAFCAADNLTRGTSNKLRAHDNYYKARAKGVIQTECLYSDNKESFADFNQ